MRTYTLLKRGTLHPDFCEDFLFHTEKIENFVISAVFDGCSGGDNSHFASSLWGKVLRTVCTQEKIPLTYPTGNDLANEILFQSILKLKKIKQVGGFTSNDLLATVILLVYDKAKNSATIIACGDGCIAINGALLEIDQDNKPDYPAYFIDSIEDKESFNKWLEQKNHIFNVKVVKDISISTDGLLTYTQIPGQIATNKYLPEDFLCNDVFLEKNKMMLSRKHNLLRTKSTLQNADDISMFRLRIDS